MTSDETTATGRRERKKAATRTAISDAALRLFLERGYDQVGVKEVADAADVAVTTLFQHFPSKEALVFDEDGDREQALVAAVTERLATQSVIDAVQGYYDRSQSLTLDPGLRNFLHLVQSTPALREYSRRMWTRHENALARAIVATQPASSAATGIAAAALARFILEGLHLAGEQPHPREALTETFGLLRTGWGEFGRTDCQPSA